MKTQACVCDSGNAFDQCCQPFLTKSDYARTPEQLMRSRYSAFALGGYGEYLLETWLPSSSVNLDAAELSKRLLNWQCLDVLKETKNEDLGTVEFKAYFLDQDGEQQVYHEISTFQRILGRWFYSKGELLG